MNTPPITEDEALLAVVRLLADKTRASRVFALTKEERRRLETWFQRIDGAAWRALTATVFDLYDRSRVQRFRLPTASGYSPAELTLPRFDASHDSCHVERVLWTALLIAIREAEAQNASVDLTVVALAALGHDLVSSVKTDEIKREDTARSAAMFAELPARAGITWEQLLPDLAPRKREKVLADVQDIILGCSATKGEPPKTLEAQAVRDADLLECIGAMGVLRFSSSSDDLPRRLVRTPSVLPEDDVLAAWDYSVEAMLHRGLGYIQRLTTETGQDMGRARAGAMQALVAALVDEMCPLASVARSLGMDRRVLPKP